MFRREPNANRSSGKIVSCYAQDKESVSSCGDNRCATRSASVTRSALGQGHGGHQHNAQLRIQLRDAVGDVGLRGMQPFSGTAKAAKIGHQNKGFDVFEVQHGAFSGG